jgi:Xaa-Pro aminopeptidase
MRRNGASGLSFPSIVASGKRSSLPHGAASHKKVEYGDFLTLDFGCVYNGYCSDITRTVIIGKASFDEDKLLDNLNAFVELILKAKPSTVKGIYVKSITISSTMGPGIKISANSFDL